MSWSQMLTWEKGPDAYYRQYILGERFTSKEMDFGKRIAEGLEKKETNDQAVEFCRLWLPKPEKKEYEARAQFESVPLLVKLDGYTTKCPKCNYDWQNKQITFQKGSNSVEQGQEIFGSVEIENEHIENRDKITAVHSGSQRENRESTLEGKIERRSQIKKKDGIQGMENQSIFAGQLGVPNLQEKRGKIGSAPCKIIQTVSRTSIRNQQRDNSLPRVPQSDKVCEICKGEPYLEISEYKTGKVKWTQERANKHGQLTIYDMVIWKLTGKIPNNRLFWIPTRDNERGEIELTGDIPQCFETERTLKDFMLMYARASKAWTGINNFCKTL